MSFRHEGNGEGKTVINFLERGNYILISPRNATNLPANIAIIVNRAFLDWMKKHPGIRIRAVLPIMQDGQTTALHVWYDRPDVAMTKEEKR